MFCKNKRWLQLEIIIILLAQNIISGTILFLNHSFKANFELKKNLENVVYVLQYKISWYICMYIVKQTLYWNFIKFWLLLHNFDFNGLKILYLRVEIICSWSLGDFCTIHLILIVFFSLSLPTSFGSYIPHFVSNKAPI